MRIRFSLQTGVLTILMVAFMLTAPQAQDFGKITDEEWAQGAPEDYPEADAVVLFDHGEMEVTMDAVIFHRHIRIKVLTEDGVDLVGERSLWYHDKYDKLKGFKAHSITPDGKKHKLEKDAIFVKEVEDLREKIFTFPQLAAGVIIEYKFRIYGERFYFLRPWYFQSDAYTLESRMTAIMSLGFDYNVSYQNVPGPSREPVVSDRMDRSRSDQRRITEFAWTMTNLPPIKDEPFMSCEEDYRSSLKFQLLSFTHPQYGTFDSYAKNWSEVGETESGFLDIYHNKQKQIREIAEEVTAGLTTVVEKSQALYQYVTANYAVSTEVMAQFRSNEKLSELLETKLGSAEELNLLLVYLHQEIGLTAYPAYISTRDNGTILVDNPTMRQFNYVICYLVVDDGYILLDTRSDKIPYGILPPSCLVNMGFLIDGENSRLERFRGLPTPSDRTDITRLYIDETGLATCTTECRMGGYWASNYGSTYEEEDPDEFVNDYFMEKLPGESDLGEYNIVLDSSNQFVVSFDFTNEDLVTTLDDNLLVQPVVYRFGTNPFKSTKRFFPVDFMYPFTFHNVLEITCADSILEVQPPVDTSFEISGATFKRHSSVENGVITINFTLDIKTAVYYPGQYSKLRDFFVNIARCSSDEIAIVVAP